MDDYVWLIANGVKIAKRMRLTSPKLISYERLSASSENEIVRMIFEDPVRWKYNFLYKICTIDYNFDMERYSAVTSIEKEVEYFNGELENEDEIGG